MPLKQSTSHRDAFLLVWQAASQMNTVVEQAALLDDVTPRLGGHLAESKIPMAVQRATMALTVLQAMVALEALELPTRNGHLDIATQDERQVAWIKQTGHTFELIVAPPKADSYPDYDNTFIVDFEDWNSAALKDIIENRYAKTKQDRITLLI